MTAENLTSLITISNSYIKCRQKRIYEGTEHTFNTKIWQ